MSGPKLVDLDDDLQVFATSNIEARFLYEEIFRTGCYGDIDLPRLSFVIDAGANIGMFALFVKFRYPGAKILAFEPVPETAAVMRQNMSLHGIADVTLREIALGRAPEQSAAFMYYPAIPGNSTMYPELAGPTKAALGRIFSPRVAERMYRGREIDVPVERLSAFLTTDRPVDLLKIDVEGSELDVLFGIDPAHWPLIRQAVVEVQDDRDRLTSVCDLLSRHGMQPAAGPGPKTDTDVPTRVVHAVRR